MGKVDTVGRYRWVEQSLKATNLPATQALEEIVLLQIACLSDHRLATTAQVRLIDVDEIGFWFLTSVSPRPAKSRPSGTS
jgi:hypothetical protein